MEPRYYCTGLLTHGDTNMRGDFQLTSVLKVLCGLLLLVPVLPWDIMALSRVVPLGLRDVGLREVRVSRLLLPRYGTRMARAPPSPLSTHCCSLHLHATAHLSTTASPSPPRPPPAPRATSWLVPGCWASCSTMPPSMAWPPLSSWAWTTSCSVPPSPRWSWAPVGARRPTRCASQPAVGPARGPPGARASEVIGSLLEWRRGWDFWGQRPR